MLILLSRAVRSALPAAATTYAGLTPTHYVAPFAQVAGGPSSDLDTATGTAYASATSEGTPCTYGEAMTNAAADDIVGLLPGYIEGQNEDSNSTPTFRPTNSGSVGHYITFVAKHPAAYLGGDLATLKSDPAAYVAAVAAHANRTELSNGLTSWPGTPGVTGCPVIGAQGSKNYIRYIGVFINGATSYSRADTGPVYFGGNTGCEVHQSVILGWTIDYIDNYSGIRLQDTNGFVLRNTILRGFRSASDFNHNKAGVLTYAARNNTFENNHVSDTHTAFFVKSALPDGAETTGNSGIIRRNIAQSVMQCADINMVHAGESLLADYNLVFDYGYSAFVFGVNALATSPWTHDYRIRNNTAARPTVDATSSNGVLIESIQGAGHEVVDNIFQTGDTGGNDVRAIDGTDFTASNSNITFTGNHYHRAGADRWTWGSSTGITSLASFETASGSSGGTTGDPLFTDSANEDFSLQGGSPAAGKGADMNNVGLQANPTL